MHSVNHYNCNGLLDLLRLLEKMLLKFEAKEEEDYKELKELLQRVHNELTENFKDYITSLETANKLITEKIKPIVEEVDGKTVIYNQKFENVVDYLEKLATFLNEKFIYSLDKLLKLIDGGDNDDDYSQSITKRLSEGLQEIQNENTKYHNDMNSLVDKHAEDVMDYDNKSTDTILDKIPDLPREIDQIILTLVDDPDCANMKKGNGSIKQEP